jgi:hypothetical protein
VVDWGTVPDWLSGIGTTGALAATLYIVLGDRRETAARQARQVQVFTVPSYNVPERRFDAMEIRFRNGSSAAISRAMIGVQPLTGSRKERGGIKVHHDAEWQVVEPGVTHAKRIEFGAKNFEDLDLFLTFRDVEGRSWQYVIGEGKPRPYELGDSGVAWRVRRRLRSRRRRNHGPVRIVQHGPQMTSLDASSPGPDAS